MGTLSRIALTRNLLRPGAAPTLWIGPRCCDSPSRSGRNRGCSIAVGCCYSCKSETWYSMIADTCYSVCVRKCFRRGLSRLSHTDTSTASHATMTVALGSHKLSRP